MTHEVALVVTQLLKSINPFDPHQVTGPRLESSSCRRTHELGLIWSRQTRQEDRLVCMYLVTPKGSSDDIISIPR
jgi:hypothetical protein